MTAPSLHTGSLHLHLKAQFAVWQGLQIAGWTTPLIFFILSHHKSKDMTCLNYMLLGFLSVEGSSLPSMLSASSFLSEFSIHGFNCQQRLSRINMVPAMHCRGHCCVLDWLALYILNSTDWYCTVHNSTGWYYGGQYITPLQGTAASICTALHCTWLHWAALHGTRF